MSFGYSVSDFIACARLAHEVYTKIRDAPAACGSFAEELLHFYGVMEELARLIEAANASFDEADTYRLSVLANGCKEILWVDILGCTGIPDYFDWPERNIPCNLVVGRQLKGKREALENLRLRIQQTKYARRIPALQRKITAHIEKLGVCLAILTQRSQYGLQNSQNRIESSQKRLEDGFQESRSFLKDTKDSIDSATKRLTESQDQIQSHLQQILAFQQRKQSQLVSRSLDASSVKGRKTWMSLGRLLAAEGITPEMITQNRSVLIQAMKDSLVASDTESFHTAAEYLGIKDKASTTRSASASRRTRPSGSTGSRRSVFSVSSPSRKSGRSTSSIGTSEGSRSALDEQENVEGGMICLFEGMAAEPRGADDEDVCRYEGSAPDMLAAGCGANSRKTYWNTDRLLDQIWHPLYETAKQSPHQDIGRPEQVSEGDMCGVDSVVGNAPTGPDLSLKFMGYQFRRSMQEEAL